jgi:hypothetical protein
MTNFRPPKSNFAAWPVPTIPVALRRHFYSFLSIISPIPLVLYFTFFSYTFDKQKNRCYMKSAISDSYKTSNMVSGIKANTHSGLKFETLIIDNISVDQLMKTKHRNLRKYQKLYPTIFLADFYMFFKMRIHQLF